MDHPSQTLRHVLNTTEQLAAEIGCQNTTLQEIIKRSGMSKGAIYHYVQSKDELFGLILQEHMLKKVSDHNGHGQGQAGGHAAPPSKPPYGMSLSPERMGPLSGIIRGLLQPANESQLVLRRCFVYLLSKQEQPDVGRILANLHQSWISFIAQWIEACQRMGLLALSISAAKTASLIVSILFGLMVQKSVSENQPVDEDYVLDTGLVLEAVAGILGIKGSFSVG